MLSKMRITASFVLGLAVCGWLVFQPETASAGTYALSAHGNTGYGVERENFPGPNIKGNCAHCHEMHASVDGEEPDPSVGSPALSALFYTPFSSKEFAPYGKTDLFCFYCHSDVVSESIQKNAGEAMKNYDYSYTVGGCSTVVGGRLVDDILETFNWPDYYPSTGSNHNLEGLQTYADANFSWFKTSTNPCSACHNPHLARRNKLNPWLPAYSAISRPSEHDEILGDDSDEQMDDYSSTYRAPYYWNSTTRFEPASSTDPSGASTPDYNDFCLDCHGTTAATITSKNHSRTLKPIKWNIAGGDISSAGDKHGTNTATGSVETLPPYNNTTDIVTSCCDCHEPHGSPYDFLIRRSINGKLVGAVGVAMGDRGNQCRQCHRDDLAFGVSGAAANEWKSTHHGGGPVLENPYKTSQVTNCGCHANRSPIAKITCDDCHYHGSYISGTATTPVYTSPSDGINTINVPPPNDGQGRKTF